MRALKPVTGAFWAALSVAAAPPPPKAELTDENGPYVAIADVACALSQQVATQCKILNIAGDPAYADKAIKGMQSSPKFLPASIQGEEGFRVFFGHPTPDGNSPLEIGGFSMQ